MVGRDPERNEAVSEFVSQTGLRQRAVNIKRIRFRIKIQSSIFLAKIREECECLVPNYCYPEEVTPYCQRLPSKKWQVDCFFQKTQKSDQSCCNEEKNEPGCFSGRFEAVII